MNQFKKLPSIGDILRIYGLQSKKQLSQNFLLDMNITNKIAKAANIKDKIVIEVGPGPGAITRSLLAAGAQQVIAIEKDERFKIALDPLVEASQGRLQVFYEDARHIDEHQLFSTYSQAPHQGYSIVGNLPYHVGTHLTLKWLGLLSQSTSPPFQLTLTYQKEVADRIVAPVSHRCYSRLSIMAKVVSEPRLCFDLPSKVFTPSPKVTSSVVHFRPLDSPLCTSPDVYQTLEKLIKTAFMKRRKMLSNSLPLLYPDIAGHCQALQLSLQLRPQDITPAQWMALALRLHHAPQNP